MTTTLMTWTTDKPSKPGFYWFKPPGMRARVIEVQELRVNEREKAIVNDRDARHDLFVVQTGMRLMDLPPDEITWAGPLEEPQ